MGKPSTPTPPNPLTTAAAATGTNVSTAIANSFLNNTNQVTPTGSLDYNQTGSYGWTDPTTGATYQVPRFTATQTLSPQEQAIQNQTLGAQYNLAGMANAQSGSVANLLATPFSPGASAPQAGNPNAISNVPQALTSYNPGGPIQTQLAPYGQQQSSFDTSGLANTNAITQSYGPSQGDLTNFTNQVQQSLMGQISPQLDVQRQQLEQKLADQGIRYGSDAYNNAFMPFNQQENNAYLQTVTGATGQAKTLMDMAAQQAGFQNSAQQQAYLQQQGIGQFANAAQQQAYQQALGSGGFANQAAAQQYAQNAGMASFANAGLAQQVAQAQSGFNAQQAARNAYLQEQYAQRNQPINEITSLLSGSQVQQPNFVNTPGSQIPTTDVAGLINTNFNQQMQNYQQQSTNYNSLMGGILGLGAGALKASDRRVKEDIHKIATVFAADSESGESKKLPIYKYAYKDDPASTPQVGPMAQDVEKITPEAVTEVGGVKHIRPNEVMGSILRAA
jgi:hypothetical protein